MFELVNAFDPGTSQEYLERCSDAAGTASYTTLLGQIRQKTARVGIIGLGYVGLPLAPPSSTTGSRSWDLMSTHPKSNG